MSIIIRNCPCFVEGIAIKGMEQKTQTCNNHKIRELTYCQDCTDCLIKQVIELCKGVDCPCCYQGEGCDNCKTSGQKELAESILQLFDIEKVE